MGEAFSFFNPVSAVIVFIYGALIGSFLNVVIYRLPLGRSIVYPGSACGTCGTPLSWWENIPIFSYLGLRGKCHTCGSTFSCRYAAIEALVGLMAVALLYHFNKVDWLYIYHFVLFAYLCVVFFMDLDHWIILDSVSLSGTAFGIVGAIFGPARLDANLFSNTMVNNLASAVIGAVAGCLFFWTIQVLGTLFLRQEAMGSGDVKLAALIGSFLGWRLGMLAFLLSFVIGAIIAIVLIVVRGQKGRDPIPFGTFMSIAAMLVVFFGPKLFDCLLFWPEYMNM